MGRVCYNAGAAGSWLFGWLFASVGGGALTGALLLAVQDVHRVREIIEGISDSSSARPSQLSGLCVVAVPLGMVTSYVMYMTISIGTLNNHVHDYLCIFVMDMTGTVRYTIIEKEGVFVANKEQDRRNIWQKENQERIIVMTSKSESPTKDQIRDAAKNAGQSMNAYILDAVRERMDREDREKE